MPRLTEILLATAVASIACSPHPGQTRSGAGGAADNANEAPANVRLRQVQRWAGDDVTVAEAGIAVSGLELFVVRGSGPMPPDGSSRGKLVGVIDGKVVEGRGLVQAAIAARPEARILAQIVLWAAQRQAEILEAPHNDQQRRVKVTPPTIVGDTLVFWVSTGGMHRRLEVATLDLLRGGLVFESPPLPDE